MKKSSTTLVFSAVGVVAVFLILIAINVIAGFFKMRADLTAEHAFTLTPGTLAILKKVDAPIQVRFYMSRGPEMPVALRNYAAEIEDMLEEFHQRCPQILVQKLDPEPDSDAEDSAKLDGIGGQQLQNGSRVYLGLSISQLDHKAVLPFLPPQRERLLEYDITRGIAQVLADKKSVVGILSPLQVFGSNPGVTTPDGGGEPAWTFVSELRRQFDVRQIPFLSDAIPADINVLVVIQPTGISEATQYAIDQFLLRGGKLVAFLDPYGVLAQPPGQMGGPASSTFDKLLPAWGIEFNLNTTVADLDYMAMTQRGKQPGVLQLSDQAFDHEDVVTGDIDNMLLLFAGAFQGNPVQGLKRTVLVKTSKHSQLVVPSMANTSPESVLNAFQSSEVEYPLAIRLSGKLKTAFPDGKPGATPSPADKTKSKAKDTSLKESVGEVNIILIGDADFVQDRASVAQYPDPFGQSTFVPANGNLYMAVNAVEQLGGDENLISVRGRASRDRPFTVVREMQANARREYQSTIQRLEGELQQTEAKLNSLQQTKAGSPQQFILTPEQQQELANFQKKQTEERQQLKQVRRDLARGIDSLEVRLKWINIGLMPLLVAIAGLTLFFVKRQRAARR